MPLIATADENGPNVTTEAFDTVALVPLVSAAPNTAAAREYPEAVPTSDAEIDVGDPSDSPIPQLVGRVTAVAPIAQFSI
jgi:hypothetical protein